MLPFLKKTKEANVAVDSEPVVRESDDGSGMESLHACMQELIDAIHAKDSHAAAIAWKSAFQICESEPHEEG